MSPRRARQQRGVVRPGDVFRVPLRDGGNSVSIVRIGLAETKNFAEGYDAIFGKKKIYEASAGLECDLGGPQPSGPAPWMLVTCFWNTARPLFREKL